MRCFFIEPSASALSEPVIIKGSDANHIKNVLRLKQGDRIILFDGSGYEYEAVISKLHSGTVEAAISRKLPSKKEPSAQIIVAQAFLKEKKMDTLVRQLTELGITAWYPFFAERSVARPAVKKLDARGKRWIKIAKEAAKQCRSARIPEIYPAGSFDDVISMGKTCDLKIIFWEEETTPIDLSLKEPGNNKKKIVIVIGPEGGFTLQEAETAKAEGFITAGLGPRILRSETASLAAVAIIQYLLGDMSPQ